MSLTSECVLGLSLYPQGCIKSQEGKLLSIIFEQCFSDFPLCLYE